ncbi:unnamed protein product [Dibothriocephalus latus]|uniref:Uncharacterized protein n=1 Tax=Dibothriocephalus latus TaxID=60516 RepID=A0A3P7L9G6_DIBLA|nr:unnamed protein product [Dibothriocephalus latus]
MSSLRLKRFRVELATLSGVILDKIFNPQQLEPIVELDPDENSSSSRPRRVPRVLLSPGTAEETTFPLPRALPWRMLADEAPQEADSHLPPSRCSPEKRPRNCLSNSTADATDSPKEYDILVLGPHHVTNLQLDVLQSGLGELADSIVNGFSYVLSRSNTFPCLSEGSVELPSSLSLACILSAARSPHGQDPDSLTVSVHRFYSLWRRWSERRLVLCPYLQAVSSGEENSNHWILLVGLLTAHLSLHVYPLKRTVNLVGYDGRTVVYAWCTFVTDPASRRQSHSHPLASALSVRSRELWVLDSLGPDPSSVKRLLKLLR